MACLNCIFLRECNLNLDSKFAPIIFMAIFITIYLNIVNLAMSAYIIHSTIVLTAELMFMFIIITNQI